MRGTHLTLARMSILGVALVVAASTAPLTQSVPVSSEGTQDPASTQTQGPSSAGTREPGTRSVQVVYESDTRGYYLPCG